MRREIVVVGAGGHAKVCIELLRSMGETVAYCIGGQNDAEHCVGAQVLKGDDNLGMLREQGFSRLFVAIGSNVLRVRLAEEAIARGYELVRAVSPQAVVSATASLGNGVAVMAGAIVNAEATIGDLVIINTGATVDHDCRIGPGVHLAPQSALAGNVTVGASSFLGIGSKVIPKVEIGSRVTIGAGSVVLSDIADGVTAVGVPAKPIKTTDK